MTLTGFDASTPPPNPPKTDVVAFYVGGDTPHLWTTAELAAQTARYRLPIWVRSNPYATNPHQDAAACIAALKAVGAPTGTCVSLDLETAVDVAYVSQFGTDVHTAGWLVLPYGSSAYLFQNPQLDGYWVALPGSAIIPANCVGVQYGQGGNGAWDNDLFLDTLPLWDTTGPPTGEDVPAPTDVVASWSVPGSDGSTYFDLHADGGLFAYGGAVDVGLEYVASANDGSRYHFGPTHTPGVFSYPGLPAADREGTRYFVSMTVLSYNGQAVGVGPAGPEGATGPQGPAGPAGATLGLPVNVTISPLVP